ncbi:MAG: AEC family transporter [Anaerolineales bacterium]|nr:AEC family transporter [Anaerolineales bacterium]
MNSLLQLFADNLLPILIVASIGYILQRTLKLNPRSISQTVFNVFTPALVLKLLLSSQIQAAEMGKMVLFATVIMALICFISWALSKTLRLNESIASAFILSATFANTGNYGLSVNQFAFGEQVLAFASLYYLTSSLLINSAGVFIATVGRVSPKQALLGLVKIPAVYAVPIALLLRTSEFELPLMLWRPLDLLASAAVPCMLIILGMQIGHSGLPKQKGLLGLTVVLQLIVAPIIALVIAPLMDITGFAFQAGIVESASPTAVLTSIIALEFDVEPDFVTGAILVTTILSPLTITPIISLLTSGSI